MNAQLQPYRIDVPQRDLDDLAERLDRTRWPDQLPGVGWRQGIPLERVRELAERWRSGYDWRAAEARLNRFPHFLTEIDGQPIHVLHARSDREDAIPLLITHGYPSSFVEFEQLIPKLLERGFHVVVPSLPGFGFSTPVREAGWAMGRTARAWAELMARLGYERYGLHGGDVGAGVSGAVGGLAGARVIGIHLVTDPHTAAATATFMPWIAGRLNPDDPVDKLALDRMEEFRRDNSGYLAIQNTRPQTLGYGLADSPVLQLAWIAESFESWTDLPIDVDQLLTNVSVYWFTGTGVSAARFLYEQFHSQDWGAPPTAPQGYSVFGADPTARRLIDPAEGTHWVEHDRGRHFPAMEAPEQLAEDLSAFFDPLR
ncbi:epoxide hydrolase family protein [Thermoactinospora rubra]|uniref:epoxide hydrolase family protein n=1 Tax=Thermoactinospora rubra TaxID=1088767 RepID=UPI000A118F56|nr:epoxide hydrolase family protein [Thermoactinospora rubra]